MLKLRGRRGKLAALAAVVATGVGGYVALKPSSACACNVTKANIWVGTAGTGASAVRHSSLVADPGGNGDFLTLDAAYQASHAGDIIAVNCGTYAAQTVAVRSSPSEAAPATVFAPVNPDSGCVTVSGTLTVAASWVAFTRSIAPTCFSVSGGHVKNYGSACSASGTANIWVAANGNNSGAHCNRSASLVANPDPTGATDCLGWDNAGDLASPGDVIGLTCGNYPAESVDAGHSPGVAPAIIYRATTPLCAAVGTGTATNPTVGLGLYTSYVTYDGIAVNGLVGWGGNECLSNIANATDHSTFTNGTANAFTFQGATNFTVSNSSFGPLQDAQSFIIGCLASNDNHAGSGLWNNNTIHDNMQGDPLNHLNCMYLDGYDNGVTISNSKFLNCAQTDIAIDSDVQGNVSNITITNNVLDTVCSHPTAFGLDDSACGPVWGGGLRVSLCANNGVQSSNVIVRNNTIAGAFATRGGTGSCTGSTGNILANNVIGNVEQTVSGDCSTANYFGQWTGSYNIIGSGYPCGTGSANATITYTNAAAYDFTVTTGTACNFVPTSQTYPSTDLAGTTRPDSAESFVDAGAYETCP